MQIELGVGVRHGKHRFLDRDIRRLTIHQDVPRNERTVVLLGRGLGPACPQQRLVRERSLEADAVERPLGPLELVGFEQEGAEHEVRLVTDRESGAVAGAQLPGPVQLLDRFCGPTVLQQGDAEVVGDEPDQTRVAVQLAEHRHRRARLARCKIDVRPQELDIILDSGGHRAFDPRQRVQRIVELTLLEVDAGEPESGLVAYGFIDGAFEHRLDGAPRAVVHAVVELEVADRELGVVDVVVKRIESGLVETAVLRELGVEPLECIEELSLVSVIERLAEIEVPEVFPEGRRDCESQSQAET